MGQYAVAPWLQVLVQHTGSDLHVKVGAPPRIRINGELQPLDLPPLTAADTERLVLDTVPERLRQDFLATGEADCAIHADDVGRFRVNAFRSMGSAAMVMRHIKETPATLTELGLPAVLERISDQHRGLILVTGPTGSGKTTTLAAMVDRINSLRKCHILTIEDPIEVVHRDKVASINQRELGSDTMDWRVALRAAMRQDPDVILVGEMRDTETVRAALAAAETGHLVMATLHTKDAAETINRVVDFFPAHEHKQIRLSLASTIQGIVCQRLIPTIDNRGRVVVMEVAVRTARIEECISDPEKGDDMEQIIEEGDWYGMRTFDQDLLRLVLDGQIAVQTARETASNMSDFDVKLKRVGIDPLAGGA